MKVCPFDDKLRKVKACFKIRGNINVILINFRRSEYKFSNNNMISIS